MDRICGQDVSVSARGKWEAVVPRILKMAKTEGMKAIQDLIKNIEDSSTGKLSGITAWLCSAWALNR